MITFSMRAKSSMEAASDLISAMPELAEVEFARKRWDPGLGQRIVAVQLHPEKRIFRGSDPNLIARKLVRQKLLSSVAKGKQLLFVFSSNNSENRGSRTHSQLARDSSWDEWEPAGRVPRLCCGQARSPCASARAPDAGLSRCAAVWAGAF